MENEVLHAGLSEVYLPDVHEVLAGFVLNREGLEGFVEGGKSMTDDLPWAEFAAPKLIYESHVRESLDALEPYLSSPRELFAQREDSEWQDWLDAMERRLAAHRADYDGLKKYYAPIQSRTLTEDFRRALEIDPNDRNAQYYLGQILYLQGASQYGAKLYDEAIASLEQAAHFGPHRLDVMQLLGHVHADADHQAEALKHYRRFLEAGGTSERAREFVESESP